VIGVVKDFHFQSLHTPIRPLLFAFSNRAHNYILIKTSTADFARKLAAIEKAYRQVEPVFGFEFSFMEDGLNRQYAAEERTGYILAVFSFTAIVIAAFGLFGMSMLAFQQRIKEVSIRKVLGASPVNLLVLLLGGFTRLILVAVIIAVPFAWYVMDGWLDNFTYQVTIHPLTFVAAALLLLSISWITLSYFTVKATRLNPAETLRSE
jgi:putative ABC transport system permease protein